jgi:hypothetical protein
MTRTTIDLRAAECSCDHDLAAVDPEHRISAHRTSLGHVVYYRCDCGIVRIKIWHWPRSLRRAA